MPETLRRWVHSDRFHYFITAIILLAAALVGLETSPVLVAQHGDVLHLLDRVVLAVFVLEIVVKVMAEGKRPWRFFLDPWNCFDFLIVAVAFLPMEGSYVTVFRLARLLRALRLVHAVPRLQILVGALLKSIPSMGYVSLLLLLVFYVYAVAGVFLFGQNDPFRFGSLALAFITLFQVATAEDWSTTLYTQMYGCTAHGYDGRPELCTNPVTHPIIAPLYFISFILIGTMIILNLFIGVIMNSMAEAQNDEEERVERSRQQRGETRPESEALEAELRALERQLGDLQRGVRALAVRAQVRSERATGEVPSSS